MEQQAFSHPAGGSINRKTTLENSLTLFTEVEDMYIQGLSNFFPKDPAEMPA